MKTALSRFFALCLLVPLLAGCQLLGGLGQMGGPAAKALAPQIEASPLALRRYPSLRLLGAYYCPTLIDNPIARLGCAVTLGPPPALGELGFEIGMTIKARNPNNIPIPMLDVLLAATLFPGAEAEGLGAICVSLCGQNDPSCNGQPKPGACTSSQSDIRRIEDFAARVPGLIQDLATGRAQEEIRKSTLAAGGDLQMDLAFNMGIEQALRIIQRVFKSTVEVLLKGQQPTLEIPVAASGTVFVNLPPVGRAGVGFGPLTTTWQLR